jgi:Domain of Unknown Function (DUF1080)
MRRDFVLVMSISLCLFASAHSYAEKAANLQPKKSKPGTLVIDEKFSDSQLGKNWATPKGDWNVANSAVLGKEKASDHHAAVLSLQHPNRNSIIQFSFKLDGAKAFHLSLNHPKGHLFRIVVDGKTLALTKDKDKKDEKSKAVPLAKVEAKFEPGKWYTMLVEMEGDRVDVQTDNGVMASGKHPGLDIDKTGYRFVLLGETLSLSDLKVWELQK